MNRTLLAVIIGALAVAALLWVNRPKVEKRPALPASRPATTEPVSRAAAIETENKAEATPEVKTEAPAPASASFRDLRNENIGKITFDGSRYLITLRNGKVVEVYPSQLDQLPPEVRHRLTYRRGGSR